MPGPDRLRRALLGSVAWASLPRARAAALGVTHRTLHFPEDFGAHPDTRTEWWYVTGWLNAGAVMHGFQVTFFRSRTGVSPQQASRFAASQLIFAHAAVTDMGTRRLRHDQRIARAGFHIAEAAEGDTNVVLHDWRMQRTGTAERSVYQAHAASESAGNSAGNRRE